MAKIIQFYNPFLPWVWHQPEQYYRAGKVLFMKRNWAFKRTPKYAVQYGKEQWRDKRYQVSLDFECILEFVFVCLGGISIGYSILNSNFGVLVILIPYTAAYAFVFSLTILQSRQEQRA
jgi:hypothetical protein